MSVSSIGVSAHSQLKHVSNHSSAPRASDGDTAAQEAAESTPTKMAEQANGGIVSKGGVNKIA